MIDTFEDFRLPDRHGVNGIAIPCLNVVLVKYELVAANTYNPNNVPPDRLELLRTSILQNGFCFPIVTIMDGEQRKFIIVDGFHRYFVSGPKYLGMTHVPIVVLDHDVKQRMAATIQFNKARGVHQVDLDADVVRALSQQGMTDEQIAEQLGMELEAVHRYKQVAGIAELFSGVQYSAAWEIVDDT